MSDRDAWLDRRRQGIGGSDVAAILGLSHYQTAFEVWRSKTTPSQPQPEQWIHTRGHAVEPFALAVYGQATGVDVHLNAECVEGPKPWMLGTPDAFAGEGLADGKSTLDWSAWGPQGDYASVAEAERAAAIPLDCCSQGQWYMAVTGRPWIDFVVVLVGFADDGAASGIHSAMVADGIDRATADRVVGGWLANRCEQRIYRLRRDEPVIRGIVSRCEAWWNRYIVAGEQHPVDGSEGASAWLREICSGQDPTPKIEATGRLASLLSSASGLLSERSEADKRAKEARNLLHKAMADEGVTRIYRDNVNATISVRGTLSVRSK
jgi:putative phage-type endonuclease